MILGNLDTLCPAIFILLLVLLAALLAISRLNKPRDIPGRLLSREDAPPLTFDSALQLNHYFPLPDGFAYTEDDDGTPTIVRIEDGLTLPYTVQEDLLTFDEPYVRPDGTVATRTHKLSRQRKQGPLSNRSHPEPDGTGRYPSV